jgi:hypothetical protein
MNDYQNPIDDLRRHVQAAARRRLEPTRQAQLQAAAVAKHESEKAERQAYEASLIVKVGEPIPQEPLVSARFKPIPISKPRVGRVAAIRAQPQRNK